MEGTMRGNIGIIIKIAILCLLIAGVIIYFESFELVKLEVEGGTHYTAEEIEEYLINGKADKFTHFFYLKYAVFSEPDPLPFVEKFEFEIVDRNTVKVTVYDKVVIGCVEHMGRYMHFDRDGIVVENTVEPDKGIPVITGIDFTRVVIGEKLEVKDDSVFKKITDLTLLLNAEGIECRRIHFDIRGKIKLYIGDSEALLGNGKVHDEQIKVLKKVLEASNGVNYRYDLENYDANTGEVVAKPINNDE